MRFIKYFLPALFLSFSLSVFAQSDKEDRIQKFHEEVEESLKKAEKELDQFYREFDSQHRAEIQRKVETALDKSREAFAQMESDFSELYSEEEIAEFERRVKESAQNMEHHLEGLQDYFNEYGFNEFYFSKEIGDRRVVLTRKELNGEVSYEKTISGKITSISKAEIDDLDTVFKNGGKTTASGSEDVISIDQNTSTTTEDGETTKSTTIKIVKKLTGGC
jgi:vacuolar-type H+-ATPase subunit H